MIVRNIFTRCLITLSVVLVLIMPLPIGAKTIAPGVTWAVLENMDLKSLTISEGADVTAPGKLLTMVADGIETGIKPGTYNNVKLIITNKLSTSPVGTNNRGVDNYRAAVYVDETGLVEDMSVTEVISGGTVTAEAATGIAVNSNSDNFSGVIVNGATEYTIKDSVFNQLGCTVYRWRVRNGPHRCRFHPDSNR